MPFRAVIEQHDGFSVDNLPIFNAPKRVVQRHFQYVDIFSLCFNAAARAGPILRVIFRQIEVEFLGNRARAHIGLKNFLYARHLIPGFFFRFGLNPAFRVKVIEQPGGRLNEILFVTIYKHRETELTRQNDGFAVAIIEQYRRAIPRSYTSRSCRCQSPSLRWRSKVYFFRLYQLSDNVSLLMMRISARFDCTFGSPLVE